MYHITSLPSEGICSFISSNRTTFFTRASQFGYATQELFSDIVFLLLPLPHLFTLFINEQSYFIV